MALGETHITPLLVRDTIGASVTNVFALCTHANINKWSRKKPVINYDGTIDEVADWYKTPDNDFSLDIPQTTLGTFTHADNWDYRIPSGVFPTSGGGIHNFRGYEHAATPPCYMGSWQTEDTETDAGFEIDLANLPLTHLDLDDIKSKYSWTNAYFGIRLYNGSKYGWFTSEALVDNGVGIGINLNDINWNNYTGLYTWKGFISNTAISYIGSTLQTQEQADIEIVFLPHEGVYVNTGSFNKIVYIPPQPPQVSFDYTDGEGIFNLQLGSEDGLFDQQGVNNKGGSIITWWDYADQPGSIQYELVIRYSDPQTPEYVVATIERTTSDTIWEQRSYDTGVTSVDDSIYNVEVNEVV